MKSLDSQGSQIVMASSEDGKNQGTSFRFVVLGLVFRFSKIKIAFKKTVILNNGILSITIHYCDNTKRL